jgi:hypothetical protein
MSSGGGAADCDRYSDLEEDNEDRAATAEKEQLARIADEEADYQQTIKITANIRAWSNARKIAREKAAAKKGHHGAT